MNKFRNIWDSLKQGVHAAIQHEPRRWHLRGSWHATTSRGLTSGITSGTYYCVHIISAGVSKVLDLYTWLTMRSCYIRFPREDWDKEQVFRQKKYLFEQRTHTTLHILGLGLQSGPEAGSFTLVSPSFGPALQSLYIRPSANHTLRKRFRSRYPLHYPQRIHNLMDNELRASPLKDRLRSVCSGVNTNVCL